jgi:hypothetical protein
VSTLQQSQHHNHVGNHNRVQQSVINWLI